METFREIENYNGDYKISSYGTVISFKSKKSLELKSQLQCGYLKLILQRSGAKPKTMLVHRLVATAFTPKPENNDQVNHVDEDEANNIGDLLSLGLNVKTISANLGKPRSTTINKLNTVQILKGGVSCQK